MTTATKISLADFEPTSVWFVSIGIPMGEEIDLVHGIDEETGQTYDMDPYDAHNSLPFEWDLEGTVNEHGEWCWDGEGSRNDWNRNSVTNIKAFRKK